MYGSRPNTGRVVGIVLGISIAWLATESRAELLGRWTFNQIKGDIAADSSERGNDAIIVGGAKTVATGKGGQGLQLDAKKKQGADAGAAFHLSDKLTLEIWLKPVARPDYETIVLGKGSGIYGLSFYKDGRAYFYVGGGANNVSIDLPLEEMSHLVGTFDGKLMRLYINGDIVAEREIAARAPASNTSLTMGLATGSDKDFFTGVIDEAAVYDHPLDEKEIQAHFRSGPSRGR